VIELVVVTPYGEIFRGDVESVVLPGVEGDFGVLEHHERFLAPLRIGEVEVKTADGSAVAAIGGGFAEVSGRQVVVLAESAEASSTIDVARAEQARNRAREQMDQLEADGDRERYAEYDEALKRATNRLAVSQRSSD